MYPGLYETEREKREAGMPSLIDALDPYVEQDLMDIQIAEILQVPAPLIRSLPQHWIGSTLILLESRAKTAELQRKRADK